MEPHLFHNFHRNEDVYFYNALYYYGLNDNDRCGEVFQVIE